MSDNKILTRLLVSRLELVLPKCIHSDQTGFVVGRHLFSNLGRMFNLGLFHTVRVRYHFVCFGDFESYKSFHVAKTIIQ